MDTKDIRDALRSWEEELLRAGRLDAEASAALKAGDVDLRAELMAQRNEAALKAREAGEAIVREVRDLEDLLRETAREAADLNPVNIGEEEEKAPEAVRPALKMILKFAGVPADSRNTLIKVDFDDRNTPVRLLKRLLRRFPGLDGRIELPGLKARLTAVVGVLVRLGVDGEVEAVWLLMEGRELSRSLVALELTDRDKGEETERPLVDERPRGEPRRVGPQRDRSRASLRRGPTPPEA